MESAGFDRRPSRCQQAPADEFCQATNLEESDLCRVAVRKLLNPWERTPE